MRGGNRSGPRHSGEQEHDRRHGNRRDRGEAQRILKEEMERLDANLRAHAGAPPLAELPRLGLKLACEEADRALASLEVLSDAERGVVRTMAERLVRRVPSRCLAPSSSGSEVTSTHWQSAVPPSLSEATHGPWHEMSNGLSNAATFPPRDK